MLSALTQELAVHRAQRSHAWLGMSCATGLCPKPLNLAAPLPLARRISTGVNSSACAPARAVQAASIQHPGPGQMSQAPMRPQHSTWDSHPLARFPPLSGRCTNYLVLSGQPKFMAFAESHRAAAAAAQCRRGSVAARQQHAFNPCIDGRTQRTFAVQHVCDHATALLSIA